MSTHRERVKCLKLSQGSEAKRNKKYSQERSMKICDYSVIMTTSRAFYNSQTSVKLLELGKKTTHLKKNLMLRMQIRIWVKIFLKMVLAQMVQFTPLVSLLISLMTLRWHSYREIKSSCLRRLMVPNSVNSKVNPFYLYLPW